ncbi:MAG: NUDIX hydrolase [Treponema sp.]|jgi:8-oxo-dGTP pyrophosphatase MutT (NUDIX family)|nr:NUDIX hydrolase [Treponema sp.]
MKIICQGDAPPLGCYTNPPIKDYVYSMDAHTTHLVWNEEARQKVFTCPIFSIWESTCRSPDQQLRLFTVLDAPDWAIVVPVLTTPRGKEFVMVRQWRHGAKELSLEFPGGVFEKGEDPQTTAARELREETAYDAGTIRSLGVYSPNPAIMANRVHFFIAEDLRPLPQQDLDEDEYVEVSLVPIKEVFQNMGRPPYIHALMGAALSLLHNVDTWRDP